MHLFSFFFLNKKSRFPYSITIFLRKHFPISLFFKHVPLKYVAWHTEMDFSTIWNKTKMKRKGKATDRNTEYFNTNLQAVFYQVSSTTFSKTHSVSKLYDAQNRTTWNINMMAQRCGQSKKAFGFQAASSVQSVKVLTSFKILQWKKPHPYKLPHQHKYHQGFPGICSICYYIRIYIT